SKIRLKHKKNNSPRTTQATILANNHDTVESLYLSPALVERLDNQVRDLQERSQIQLEFARL
ncbi:MAG: hypothetical protein OXT74_12415, partial [Candidatus Poribacteria bacterium]|nr:hypothetical protein [Candidatus Poribacteria bacterium]